MNEIDAQTLVNVLQAECHLLLNQKLQLAAALESSFAKIVLLEKQIADFGSAKDSPEK